MPNPENVKPFEFTSDQDREKAAINGRKGGKASGEAKRRKKTLRELFEIYGSMPNTDDPKLTNDEKLVLAQYREAIIGGSTSAATFIRDTKGEKPHDVVETPNIEIKPLVDMTGRKKNGAE
jgi:general stress protein YciG